MKATCSVKPFLINFDSFSADGVSTVLTYSDGQTTTIYSPSYSGYDNETAGEKTITVSYRGLSATYTLQVVEEITRQVSDSINMTLNGLTGKTVISGSGEIPSGSNIFSNPHESDWRGSGYKTAIKTAEIADGITSVYGFDSCVNLTTVQLPDNLNKVEYNAFSGCSNLQEVTLSENVTTVNSSAFSSCTNTILTIKNAKKGWMYNIATDSVYGAAGMNVVMTSKGWDPMGPIINMNLYLTKEEGAKSFQPKGNYLSGTDTDLKESGKAADAKVTGKKIAKNSSDIAKKLDKNQGSENSGKVAGINEVGDIVPMLPMGVEYNSETNCLEFGSDQKMKLNQGIGLDNTLTKSGSAADAGVTGKKIDSLKEDLSTKITKFYASSQGETHLADSDNGKIMDMMVYGKSEQKQYSGKNLLNAAFKTYTYSGVTLTNNGDGTCTIEGTNNSSGELIFSLVRTVDEQKALYNSLIGKNVKFIVESGSTISGSVGRICFVFYNKTENRFSNETYNGGNVTVPTGYDSSVVDIHINVGQTVPKTILKPMIVDASLYPDATYDDFEPYTGGIPSPNPDYPQEIKSVVNPTVKVCGKNLLKATLQTTTVNGVTCTNNGDGTYTLNGTAKSQAVFRLFDIKENIYGGKLITGCSGGDRNTFNIVVFYYNKDRKWTNEDYEVGNGKTIKAKNESSYLISIGILIRTGHVCNNIIFKPMIAEDTVSAFEPYHEQTVTLPYTLNAIPVNSGGNVTIDGQQYIADYVDVERGKLVRMCKELVIKNATFTITIGTYSRIAVYGILPGRNITNRSMCSHSINKDGFTLDESHWYIYNETLWIFLPTTEVHDQDSLDAWLENNDLKILVTNEAPEEIDLTDKEIKALKSLATYYPTTNISVNSEQLDGYTVFNYPISMANGWNYVKQQIGDTRDYIYDMDARTQDIDTQSAEAYVNSEYAVALTELEV